MFRFDFMFVKPHDAPLMFCFDVQSDMKFNYSSPCLFRVGVVKSLVSVCTFKQNIRGTSRGFANIKSNRNMSRSD